jgi:hypothetical protein
VVGDRRHRRDARRRCLQQVGEEQPREGEVPEVVGAELHLETVAGLAVLRRCHDPRVVDEQVERSLEPGGEVTHRLLRGEVESFDAEDAGHTSGADPLGCRLTGIRVAHREHDVSAVAGELTRLDGPDAGVRAGDEGAASGEVGNLLGGPTHAGSS